MGRDAGGVFPFVALHPVDGSCMVSRRETNVATRAWGGKPVTRATAGGECAGVLGIGFYPGGTRPERESGMVVLPAGV